MIKLPINGIQTKYVALPIASLSQFNTTPVAPDETHPFQNANFECDFPYPATYSTMKITTTMLADELFQSVNENGHAVTIDTRKREEKVQQSPVELLLSAVAACGAVDIVVMLKKRKKTIQKFIIETEGTRQEETPHYFTKIHCTYQITSPDVTVEELHKAAALSLEKYCSVASSLKAEITFSAEVIRP